jgi:hypothetical protein
VSKGGIARLTEVKPNHEVQVMLFDGTYQNKNTLFAAKGEPSLQILGKDAPNFLKNNNCRTGNGAQHSCGTYVPGSLGKYVVPADVVTTACASCKV